MKEDLYALWLGIPPGPRPPNHYHLLGVPLFSNDIDTIEKNTRSQIVRLDQYALHRDREKRNAVQEMMNQVAQARVCLVNPDRKAEYDASLARSLNVPLPAPPPPPSAWVQEVAPAQTGGLAQSAAAQAQPLPAQAPSRAPATAGQIDPVEIFRQRLRRHLLKWELNPAEEMLLLAEADNLGIAPKLARRIIRQIDAECQDVAEEKSRLWTVGVAGFAVLAILIGAAFIFVPRWRQSQKEKEFADRLAIATRFLDAGLYDDMETELAQAEKILPGNPGIQEFRVKQADRMLALADAAARAEKPADARRLLDAIHRFASTDPRFRRLNAQVEALEKAAKDRQLAAENEKVQRQLVDMVSHLQKGEFPAADAIVAPLMEDFSRWPHTAEFVRPALTAALTEMLKSSSWTAAAKTAEIWARLDAADETASVTIASAAKSLLESSRRHAAAGETDAARLDAQAALTLKPASPDAMSLLADLAAKPQPASAPATQPAIATTAPATQPAVASTGPASQPAITPTLIASQSATQLAVATSAPAIPASAPATSAPATTAPATKPAGPSPASINHLKTIAQAFVDSKTGLALTAGEGMVKLWDLKTGNQRAALDFDNAKLLVSPAIRGGMAAIAFDPPAGQPARRPIVLNLATGGTTPLEGDFAITTRDSLQLSLDGTLVLGRNRSKGAFAVWDTATGKQRPLDPPWPAGSFIEIVAPADLSKVIGVGIERAFMWAVGTGKVAMMQLPLDPRPDGAKNACVSADGRRLFLLTNYRGFAWDLATGAKWESPKLVAEPQSLSEMRVAPNGARALLSNRRTSFLWNLEYNPAKGERHTVMEPFYLTASPQIAYSPDGRTAAAFGAPPSILIVDFTTGKYVKLASLAAIHDRDVSRALRFSPKGDLLIAPGMADVLAIEPATLAVLSKTPLHSGTLLPECQFSEDLSIMFDQGPGTLRVIDLRTGKQVVELSDTPPPAH